MLLCMYKYCMIRVNESYYVVLYLFLLYVQIKTIFVTRFSILEVQLRLLSRVRSKVKFNKLKEKLLIFFKTVLYLGG